MPIAIHSSEIHMRELATLRAYENNARTHPEAQIGNLMEIIRDSGFTNPLIIEEDGTIIAGHGRAMAAERLGMVEVPCVVVRGLTPPQIRTLRLSDNAVGLQSGWDNDMLRIELSELSREGINLSLAAFSVPDLQELKIAGYERVVESADPDEVIELPPNPVTRLGDLWHLGDHRLICGDCTRKEVVERVMGTKKPHLMVSDPPYGVEYDPDFRNESLRGNGKPIGGRAVGKVMNDDKADWRDAWALFPGDVVYIWHAGIHAGTVQTSIEVAGFVIRSQIIWRKSNFAIGRGDYHWGHEPAFYAVRKGKPGRWAGDRTQSTVWDIAKPQKSETGHSTQKPVECMARPMRNNSKIGDYVYDPFMGSGTTIVAAQTIGRVALGCELNPQYVDVAILRWQNLSGSEAVLASTGETYAQVKAKLCDPDQQDGATA